MHKEILVERQIELLLLVGKFSRSFGLVGGTAVALQIGHRRSIDFDLFSHKKFQNISIKKKIAESRFSIQKTIVNKEGEFTFMANEVKVTFFQFPYKLDFEKKFEGVVRMPSLLTLAAMKAFALGQRNKWKDYVDMCFIMEKYHGIIGIIKKAKELFGAEFNEKLFRNQLAYFDDIDYSEEVEYLEGFEVDDEKIRKKLIEFSLAKK
jgi:hypothetical protein